MKLLGLVEAPDHVCCRYRIDGYVPGLRARGWEVVVRALPAGLLRRWRVLREHDGAEVVLLQRKLLDAFQFAVLRHRARRLVYDFDDAVLYRDSHSPNGPHSRRRSSRFRRTVAVADLVLAGNSFLAEQAAQFTRPERIRIIPTCVDPELYPIVPAEAKREGGLELVWIGSSSTLRGLEQARRLFEALGQAVVNLRLKVVADRFPVFDHLRVVPVRWSVETEVLDLASADIGISWVPDDLWSRGKCGLKLLQYMAAALPVVANPVGVHREMIEHGQNGFLVQTEAEWINAIRTLAADPALRQAMGRRGRRLVEDKYNVTRWASRVAEALAG